MKNLNNQDIKNLRVRLNWSQQELADELGSLPTAVHVVADWRNIPKALAGQAGFGPSAMQAYLLEQAQTKGAQP